MIAGNPVFMCPGPCYACGTVTESISLLCEECIWATANPTPQREHPQRCVSCKQWKCTPACLETSLQLALV